MVQSLPARPDLDVLRRQARALQRAANANGVGGPLTLAKAQTALARDYGFASWPKLKAEVDARRSAALAASADARALAERWFALARDGDLPALLRSTAIGKARLEAAREVMRVDPLAYRGFVELFLAGLAHRTARVRFGSAHALDQFGDERCREPLVRLMEDPVPRVRWMAMHALSCHACGGGAGGLDAEVEARIIAAANHDPSIKVRRHAAGALGLGRGAHAAPVLRALLETETDPKLRNMAAWALGQCEKVGQRR